MVNVDLHVLATAAVIIKTPYRQSHTMDVFTMSKERILCPLHVNTFSAVSLLHTVLHKYL